MLMDVPTALAMEAEIPPKPVAGEALGGGERSAVYGAIAGAIAVGVTLEAAQHLDCTAMDSAGRLGEQQLGAVGICGCGVWWRTKWNNEK